MINIVWLFLWFLAFVSIVIKLLLGDYKTISTFVDSLFNAAELGFEISLGLTGILTLWLGLLKVAEKSGLTNLIAKVISPLIRALMPEIPKNHSSIAPLTLNMVANILGLDNAATPIGLKAMKELQKINPDKNSLSNAQIMFLVINSSSVTLIPITIIVYRAQLGASNPTDVLLPIIVATYSSTLVGILTTAFIQRINIFNKAILSLFTISFITISLTVFLLTNLPSKTVEKVTVAFSNVFIASIIFFILLYSIIKGKDSYSDFVEGAKEGFSVAVMIIPYLVAMLIAIAAFRASGTLNYILDVLKTAVHWVGLDDRFVDALPTAFLKPLSGSGARAMMIDTIKTFGADSLVGRMVSVMQGSTETTFYVLALYTGAVGIKNVRYAIVPALSADIAGITTAIIVTYLLFE